MQTAKISVDGVDEYGNTYETPWAGTLTVQTTSHPYYGMHEAGYACCKRDAAWTVEFAGNRENAERIVRNSAAISEIVARHGGHERVSVKFEGDAMIVREYDFRKWTEQVDEAK